MNPSDLEREVRHLLPLCCSPNEEIRAACRDRVQQFRDFYTSAALAVRQEVFRPQVIEALREAGKRLEAPPDHTLLAALKKTFGFDHFRPGQEEIVRCVLAGIDCVAVMPTGGGKSLTFQLPARMAGGITLVISPLIALMKDQVDALNRRGLRATYLNSSLKEDERRQRILAIKRGEVELVYAAPEGLDLYIASLLEGVNLRLVAVDEAHCISEWGHDFRPAYRNFAGLKQRFASIPILALTATATKRVQQDIIAQLGMQSPACFQGSFYRSNLKIFAIKKGEGPSVGVNILKLVRARKGQCGIIYCQTRNTVMDTADALRGKGIRSAAYHAGLDSATRSRAQEAFQKNELDVIVATVAFGMGIDKSDIRYVIHRDMPKSMEGFAQEIGRAGRDGKDSDCILFYAWPDVLMADRLSDNADDPEVTQRRRRQVREMFRYADTQRCRHQALAANFGERLPPCGNACDVCTKRDILAEAGVKKGSKAARLG